MAGSAQYTSATPQMRVRESLKSHFNALAMMTAGALPLCGTLCHHFGASGAAIGFAAAFAIYAAGHVINPNKPSIQGGRRPGASEGMDALQRIADEMKTSLGLKQPIAVSKANSGRMGDSTAWTDGAAIYFQEKKRDDLPDMEDKRWLIAHELGHIANEDATKALCFFALQAVSFPTIIISQLSQVTPSLWSVFGHGAGAALLPWAAVGYMQLCKQKQKRDSEYGADRVAFYLTGHTGTLEKIAALDNPHKLPEIIDAHPSRDKRVAYTASLNRRGTMPPAALA